MTQLELSRLLDITPATVSQWEIGYSVPRLPMIEKMADIFSVPLSVIMGEERPPLPSIAPRVSETAYLPLRGRVHAGDPCDPEELDASQASAYIEHFRGTRYGSISLRTRPMMYAALFGCFWQCITYIMQYLYLIFLK